MYGTIPSAIAKLKAIGIIRDTKEQIIAERFLEYNFAKGKYVVKSMSELKRKIGESRRKRAEKMFHVDRLKSIVTLEEKGVIKKSRDERREANKHLNLNSKGQYTIDDMATLEVELKTIRLKVRVKETLESIDSVLRRFGSRGKR